MSINKEELKKYIVSLYENNNDFRKGVLNALEPIVDSRELGSMVRARDVHGIISIYLKENRFL